jgi:hypothetical protein
MYMELKISNNTMVGMKEIVYIVFNISYDILINSYAIVGQKQRGKQRDQLYMG